MLGKYKRFILIISIMVMFILASATDVQAARRDGSIPNFDFIDGMEEIEQPIIYNNKKLSIKGKALEGTNITISTYWYKADKKEHMDFEQELPEEDNTDSGEWILQHTENCQVGLSQIFGISVSIKPGRNKIVVETDNEQIYEIELEYIDNEKITEKIFNDILFDRIDMEFQIDEQTNKFEE